MGSRGASPSTGHFSSIGLPSTSNTRPSVTSPTGTRIGPPVSLTATPRARPSVVVMATERTQLLPRCCCTSHTSGSWPLRSMATALRIAIDRKGQDPLVRSEEHTSELQSLAYLVCRLLLEKKTAPQHDQRPP